MSEISWRRLESGKEPASPALPLEVLLEVMECLGRWSKKTLLELMLSCRGLYELGVTPLMRDIDIRGWSGGLRLWWAHLGNDKLARVRNLWIGRWSFMGIGSPDDWADFLRRFLPSLETFHFSSSLGTLGDFAMPIFSMLRELQPIG